MKADGRPVEGLSRDAIEEAAARDGSKRSPNMRPRDAATLIILDGHGPKARFLMGRRHERHKFMPGLFVFPGGRVDRGDGSIPAAGELDERIEARIVSNLRGKPTRRRARALALAGVRETYEEAGLFLGIEDRERLLGSPHPDWQAFDAHGVVPDLSQLALVARAITPPGRNRRFDAWFFAARMEDVAARLPGGIGPTDELEDVHWMDMTAARKLELPVITVAVLDELEARLTDDPDLSPHTQIPFYHMKSGVMTRELI